MKQKLKIAFVDFWANFGQEYKSVLLRPFENNYDVEEVTDDADVALCSCFGNKHERLNARKKVFVCGENKATDFSKYDYALTTIKEDNPKSFYWPEGVRTLHLLKGNEAPITDSLCARGFCTFLARNKQMGNGAKLRTESVQLFSSKYKSITCPGRVNNTVQIEAFNNGAWRQKKLDYIAKFKFNIAYENSYGPGYITEKLIDCYLAKTVPIYWGAGGDVHPFPKASMICANNYTSKSALLERIKEVDNDPEQYMAILRANPFLPENKHMLPDWDAEVTAFCKQIVEL